MITLGIDPGTSGALFVCGWSTGWHECADLPTFTVKRGKRSSRDVDHAGLVNLIEGWRPIDVVVIEGVWAMQGDMVSWLAGLMKSAGIAIGVCAGLRLRIEQVSPGVWKREMRLPAGPALTDKQRKDAARKRASELMPWASQHWRRVLDHGRAEAALLAFYGQRFAPGDPFA